MLLARRQQNLCLNMPIPSGFSLIEMAVVLAVVALLLAGMMPTLSSQMDLKKLNETRNQMEEVRASLMGYAVAHGRLPCPDTDNPRDGLENILLPVVTPNFPLPGQSTKTYLCSSSEGGLPYNQTGVSALDPYNNPIIYRVDLDFAQRNETYDAGAVLINTTYFSLTTGSNLRICNNQACAAPRVTDTAVAVIVSTGKNGMLAASPDEAANKDNTNDFVSREQASDFDDVVLWISPNTLFNRMVAAGKLP